MVQSVVDVDVHVSDHFYVEQDQSKVDQLYISMDRYILLFYAVQHSYYPLKKKQILKSVQWKTASSRNSVTPLPDRNSEMKGRRELSDVVNSREIYFEDFEMCPSQGAAGTRFLGLGSGPNPRIFKILSPGPGLGMPAAPQSELIKMFPGKSITKISTVGIGISVIEFPGNIFMSSGGFQNLQNKFFFNLRRRSALCDLPFQSYDVTLWTSRKPPFFSSIKSDRKLPMTVPLNLTRSTYRFGI